MCQALSEGGRRCPVHRRDSIAAMYLARQESHLPADIVESLFSELRREGRHLVASGLSTDSYEGFTAATSVRLAMTEGAEEYVTIFGERASDDAPTADTLYALQRIRGAAMSRSAALDARLATAADALGVTPLVARERFDALRAAVDTSRGSETPAEYTSAAQQAAFDADLPHDRASVTALARLDASPERESEPRCANIPLTERSRALDSGGYDPEGGRLEIRFASNPEHTYAYHDVPEEVWTQISETSDNPMHVYTSRVRGNRAYMYESNEAAAADSTRVRCAACGQFAASGHSCPERRVVAVAESMGITLTPESTAVVAEAAADEEIESDRVEALVAEAAIAETLPEVTPLAAWEQALLDGDVSDTASSSIVQESATGESVLVAAVNRETLVYGEDAGDTDSTPDESASDNEAEAITIGFDRPLSGSNGGYLYRSYTEDDARAIDAAVDELVASLNNGRVFTPPSGPTPVEGADLTSDSFTQTTTEVAISRRILESRRYELENYVSSAVVGVPEGFSTNNGVKALLFRNPATGQKHFVAAIDTTNLYYLSNGDEYRVNGYNSPAVFNITPNTRSYGRPSITDEEHARVRAAYGATADGQRVRTTVDSNATRTRAYAPSVLTESGRNVMRDQTTQWAGVRDVRRVLAEDGGTVSSPITWSGIASHTFVDQHGYAIDGGSFNVSGTLAITNDGGTLRTTSGAHELRCSCERYRRTYHCSHVDYVRNNAPRMAAKMNVRPNRTASGENTGPYPVTLMNRSGFSHRTNDDGTNVGVFSDISSWGNMNRRAGEEFRISEVMRPDEVGSEGNVSVEQSMRAYQALNSGVRMSRSTPVLSALRRGTVEMSVSSSHMYDIDETSNPSVTGSVVISRDEAGAIAVGQGTLRCTCGRFASAAQAGSGTCPHVNLVADSVGRRLTAAALRDPDEQQFASNESINVASESQHAERMIRQEMASVRQRSLNAGEVISEEDVRTRATDRIAAREAEREADRLRAEARREQQRAQEAERQRVEAMSYEERAVHSRQRHVQERADYLAANPEFAANLVAYRAAREAAWSEAEEGYGDNIAQARADADEAIAAKNAGEAFLTPLTENVTDGICDPNVPGSRKFGVELEFDIKSGVDHDTAIRNIVRELREAGLTDQQRIGGYHSGRSSGWSQWNLEQDCTVSGELVSPLMSDTPEDWAKMKTALDILNRNGAKASVRTGSHVHVSTGSYVGSIAKHTELIRTVQDHQDVIYRAAADPKRGTHRGTQWCGPNRSTPPVSVNADDPSGLINGIDHYAHNGHGYMMNLEGTTSMNTKAHAEFRMWDATLDLATIQQQVATSAALADYADRTVENSGQSTGRERPATIDGVVHGGRSISDDAMKNATELADKIFRRQSDRKRFVSLFGVNKWA